MGNLLVIPSIYKTTESKGEPAVLKILIIVNTCSLCSASLCVVQPVNCVVNVQIYWMFVFALAFAFKETCLPPIQLLAYPTKLQFLKESHTQGNSYIRLSVYEIYIFINKAT
jgi:hypothetical protein